MYSGLLKTRVHHRCANVNPALAAQFDFAIAIAAIHRSTGTRFEGYLGVLATIGAFCGKHLAHGSVVIGPIAAATVSVATAIVSELLCFSCLAA